MAASKLVLLSKKMIKPFTPTSFSHRIHKLSLMDQMGTNSSIPMVFFYPKHDSLEPTKVSQILEDSLSKVLTSYYPFAGRVKDNSFVECNDMGVDFFEVQIDCPLSRIFDHPRTYIDSLIFPKGVPWSSPVDSLVTAQLSHLECGGIVLSACISHKVTDGYGMVKFLYDWAMIARDGGAKPFPMFNGSSDFQPMNFLSTPKILDPALKQNASERYHFSASKLRSLKQFISAHESRTRIFPTTVEAVTAFLCKCVNTPTFRPLFLLQAVNLRGKNNDALAPADLVGNAIFPIAISAANEEELNLERLIGELRKGKEKIHDKLKYIKSEELLCSTVSEIASKINERTSTDDFSIYRFTSLRKFPLHDIDFGWGRPRRVDVATAPVDMFALLDTQSGDGLDVLVNLEQGEMSAFQSNDELLQFASPSSGL